MGIVDLVTYTDPPTKAIIIISRFERFVNSAFLLQLIGPKYGFLEESKEIPIVVSV
jgi:hypothetical protein